MHKKTEVGNKWAPLLMKGYADNLRKENVIPYNMII